MSHYVNDSTSLLSDEHRTFTIKQGDTSPKLMARLEGVDTNLYDVNEVNPIAIDLTQASVIYFIMSMDGETYIKEEVEIQPQTGTTLGEIHYSWQTNDTQYIGAYACEFEVHWVDGTQITFPQVGAFSVVVVPDHG